MKEGRLFSKARKTSREYQKSFCFAETPRSAFWDREEQAVPSSQEVTHEEAQRYDAIMKKILSKHFF